MAQVVEADARQARVLEHTLEGPADPVGTRGTAGLVGEYEVEVGPPAGGREALRDLAHPLTAERGGRRLSELLLDL